MKRKRKKSKGASCHSRDVGVVRAEKVCLAMYGKYFGLSEYKSKSIEYKVN